MFNMNHQAFFYFKERIIYDQKPRPRRRFIQLQTRNLQLQKSMRQPTSNFKPETINKKQIN